MNNKKLIDFLLKFLKGMLIGTGAILPGVSGGALAAVFGLYERLIDFIANITKDFKNNFLYFLPVGLGGVAGIFLLSIALSYLFEHAETQILWFFVGCIVGILPSLFKQAQKKGKKNTDYIIMVFSAALLLVILRKLDNTGINALPLNFYTWIFAGAIFALGLIIPGLSPSNFLVYLGIYKPMTDGIKNLDFSIIIPMGIGAVIILLLLSKLINFIFIKAYSQMFHFIIGVVIASTIMIIPFNSSYTLAIGIVCVITCMAGIILGLFMNKLEEEYKPD